MGKPRFSRGTLFFQGETFVSPFFFGIQGHVIMSLYAEKNFKGQTQKADIDVESSKYIQGADLLSRMFRS
jgi:hypothetical protein